MGNLFGCFALIKLGVIPKDTPFPRALWFACFMAVTNAQGIAAVTDRLTDPRTEWFPVFFISLALINMGAAFLLMRIPITKSLWPFLALCGFYFVVLGGLFYVRHLNEAVSF